MLSMTPREGTMEASHLVLSWTPVDVKLPSADFNLYSFAVVNNNLGNHSPP